MTELTINQALSRQDQMDAHRRDFLAWWTANILPHFEVGNEPPDAIPLSQDCHWRAWKRKHGLEKMK